MDIVTLSGDLTVQPSEIMALQSDASVETLCKLLIECEKAQRRYQWASGFLLVTLMGKPDAPKKPSEFADWLTTITGMRLTQNEIRRRVTVYKFYSPFADTAIIELIERGGLRLAYEARRVIAKPEQAHDVLQSHIDQHTVEVDTPKRSRRRQRLAERARAAAKKFDNEDWVPLALVVELLGKP